MELYNLDCLNEEQLVPVIQTEGAVLVTAGAGSGKTRMLTHRIAHLISNKGIPAYNILAITFTNKAASEMKERLAAMLPETRGLWVSTFHSMCVSILRKFIDSIGYQSNFSIYSETEKERTIKKKLKDKGIEDVDGLSKRISEYISSAKNEGYSPDEFAVINKFHKDIDVISAIYAAYERELKLSNALDFDDLLLCAHKLLKHSEEARQYYQDRFRYIHVDEFQDTNNIQYKLLLQLSAKHKNVFVVGDEDQSIYGWRGANIDNIKNFVLDYGAKIFKLEQNYRSTKVILEAANTLISHNTSRIEKKLWTENEEGLDITTYVAPRDTAEADYVLATISSLLGKGYRFSDMAILMRVNALSRGFEQRLLQYGVPYKIFGGFKFFERKEVKDILAYARMISNYQDNEAILRIINFPKRGIGDAAIKQLINYTIVSHHSLFDVILGIEKNADLPTALISKVKPFSRVVNHLLSKRDLPPHEFLSAIVEAIELKKLYSEPTEENQNRLMHIDELITSASEFFTQNPTADINDYLQMVTLYTDTDEMDDSKDYVSLATVHSAKGLEFPVVFIVGLEEGMFPLSRSIEDNEIEEERRLMYVAITRAKTRLYITLSRSRFLYGNMKDTLPSRFLEEAGLELATPDQRYDSSSQRGYASDSGRGGYGGYGNDSGRGGYSGYGSDSGRGGYSGYGNDSGRGGYSGYGSDSGRGGYGGYGNDSGGGGYSGYGGGYANRRDAAGGGSNNSRFAANNGARNSQAKWGQNKSDKKLGTTSYVKPEPKAVVNENVALFREGMTVKHRRFGLGKILSIQRVGNNYAEIEFKSGKMTLALNFAPLEIVEQ